MGAHRGHKSSEYPTAQGARIGNLTHGPDGQADRPPLDDAAAGRHLVGQTDRCRSSPPQRHDKACKRAGAQKITLVSGARLTNCRCSYRLRVGRRRARPTSARRGPSGGGKRSQRGWALRCLGQCATAEDHEQLTRSPRPRAQPRTCLSRRYRPTSEGHLCVASRQKSNICRCFSHLARGPPPGSIDARHRP